MKPAHGWCVGAGKMGMINMKNRRRTEHELFVNSIPGPGAGAWAEEPKLKPPTVGADLIRNLDHPPPPPLTPPSFPPLQMLR
jgi:hypothetical protein